MADSDGALLEGIPLLPGISIAPDKSNAMPGQFVPDDPLQKQQEVGDHRTSLTLALSPARPATNPCLHVTRLRAVDVVFRVSGTQLCTHINPCTALTHTTSDC